MTILVFTVNLISGFSYRCRKPTVFKQSKISWKLDITEESLKKRKIHAYVPLRQQSMKLLVMYMSNRWVNVFWVLFWLQINPLMPASNKKVTHT